MILANTITLALEDPSSSNEDPTLKSLENIYLYIFTAEMFIKMMGNGLFRPVRAYFRDSWNFLDFIIILTSWIAVFLDGGVDLTSLRTLRILRPLRSISSIKGLRLLFLVLIGSIKQLLGSLVILLFFFLLFAITGLQLWMGVLRNRCVEISDGVVLEDRLCGNLECPGYTECGKYLDNPNYGVTSFDDILHSLLTVFQCVTLEGWSSILNMLQVSFSEWVILYFVPLVFIGAFFLLNITLTVLKSSFTRIEIDYKNRINLKKEEASDTISLFSEADATIEKESNMSITSPEVRTRYFKSDSFADNEKTNLIEPLKKSNTSELDKKNNSQMQDTKILDRTPCSFSRSYSFGPCGTRTNISSSNIIQDNGTSAEARENDHYIEADESLKLIRRSNTIDPPKISSILDEEPDHHKTTHEYTLRNSFKEIETKPVSSQQITRIKPLETMKDNKEDNLINATALYEYLFSHRSILNNEAVSQLISKLKGKVRVTKELMGKVEKNLRFETQVQFLKDYKLECTSDKDIILNDTHSLRTKPLYIFRYKIDPSEIGSDQNSDDSLVTQTRSDIVRFNLLLRRLSKGQAFSEIFKGKLMTRHELDQLDDTYTMGYWSGFEVDPIFRHNSDYCESFSNMKFRIWGKGWIGSYEKLSYPIYILVTNRYFNFLMTLMVVLNTIVLSLNHYGIDPDMELALNNLNYAFTMVFVAETALKVIGLGIRGYFKDRLHLFDLSIVVFSLIELMLTGSKTVFSAFRAIRILKTFRVLRVARLFRYLQPLARILKVIGTSVSKIIYLALLLLLFIIIFALVGMEIFGGKFNFEEGHSRANFDTFYNAFITVFQILTMENWQIVLYDGMRAVGDAACLYFILWIFIGNYILLNLFLAIVLDSFAVDELLSNENEGLVRSSTSQYLTFRRLGLKRKYLKTTINRLEKVDELESSVDGENERMQEKPLFSGIECEKSLFIFSQHNKFRIQCYRLTSSIRFEQFILTVICISTVKLIWDTYLLDYPDDSPEVTASFALDLVFTIVFIIEALLKIVSMGFLLGGGTYLKDSWNRIDFIIVVMSLIELFVIDGNYSIVRIFRLVRTLRPLRFINQNLSIKVLVTALLESIVAILNVGIVIFVIYLIFAILGVSLFAGKFYSCTLPIIDNMQDCEDFGYSWKNAISNFDNVYEAMLTLFTVSSLEGWPTVMYMGIDATEEKRAPIRDYNPAAAFYFISFIIIGTFFFLNLFNGVIFDHFQKAKNKEASLSAFFLQKDQLFWVQLQSYITSSKPSLDISNVPANRFRRKFYFISKSRKFETFILFCILVNIIQMAIQYEGASLAYTTALENINTAFTAIFLTECLIKLIGFGPRAYFYQDWNKFDFFVVSASLMELILNSFSTSSYSILRTGPQIARAVRLFRITRLFRVMKSLKVLQDLLYVLSHSLPAVLNVMSLLMIILLIYSVLGVYLFHTVTTGEQINSFFNFKDFHHALITLLRISTGEDWHSIMHDCIVGIDSMAVPIYFITFTIIMSFIMLNMFIMVMIQDENEPDSALKVFMRDLKIIRKSWVKYTKHTKGLKINLYNLIDFMRKLGDEYGAPESASNYGVMKLVGSMNMHIKDGHVYYNDMLFSILKRRYFRKAKFYNDKLIANILHNEEISTKKKLAKLREKYSKIVYADSRNIFLNKLGDTNMLFSFMTLKKILRSWRSYVVRRKEGRSSVASSDGRSIYRISEEDDTSSIMESRHIYSQPTIKKMTMGPIVKMFSH